MKVLDTNQFVSERMKIKPVTNAEMERMKDSMLNGMNAVNIVKPGDKLEAGDLVLVACKGLDNDFFRARYGVYSANVKGYIEYTAREGLYYQDIRDTFEYIYYNTSNKKRYGHYIMEIFRHENGEWHLILTKDDRYENIRKMLINSTAYKCVYRNAELMEKFNMI